MVRKYIWAKSQLLDHGRTMIETLGVLAVMGVLSLFGVLGYEQAARHYRENETVDQFSKTIASARTGFIKERYMDVMEGVKGPDGETRYTPVIIPLSDIISGVRVNGGPCPYEDMESCGEKWTESYRTPIGADVWVQVDNPHEFSVLMRASEQEERYEEWGSVCRRLVGYNFGQDYFYLKGVNGSVGTERYKPEELVNNEEEVGKICDLALQQDEEGNVRLAAHLVFVFRGEAARECETDEDCIAGEDELCECKSVGDRKYCDCRVQEDVCYEEHQGLLTNEIYGGSVSGAWPGLSGSSRPSLTSGQTVGQDCCDGAMVNTDNLGASGKSKGFVYVDPERGVIDCCPGGTGYKRLGGDVVHPTYYFIDDAGEAVHLPYAQCGDELEECPSGQSLCLDGCCEEACGENGLCSSHEASSVCDCPSGQVCVAQILNATTLTYGASGATFSGGEACCALGSVYYDISSGALSCCNDSIDKTGDAAYLIYGSRVVPEGCCGLCPEESETTTDPEESVTSPGITDPAVCPDSRYPYACDTQCCAEADCGGDCVPLCSGDTPYWCSGSNVCCAFPCQGDQCPPVDCGDQVWCAAGGDNGTGACCDTCCADNSCPTDHPDNSCEQAETTVVSQVCPAQNAACGVTCSGGVARCDIVDLREGENGYPGSSATFKKADGTGEQCCYGTVYVDANGEVACTDEAIVLGEKSDYADNSDGNCSPLYYQGENVCCPTGGIAYFDVDQDSAACCSEDYLYDISGTTIQTVCNGTTQLLESKVCSSCGGEDVYLGAVIKDNQPVDKDDINTTETGSSLCCKNSADIYGYFDGTKRLIHYGDMNVNNNCDMSSIYVDDNNYYGICGDGRIFYVNDDTDEVSCCNLSDGSVLAYRLTGSQAVFDDRFSLTLDGLTKYPLRGLCLSSSEDSSEDNGTIEETSTTIPETTVTDGGGSDDDTEVIETIPIIGDETIPIIGDDAIKCCGQEGKIILKDGCNVIIGGCCCQEC